MKKFLIIFTMLMSLSSFAKEKDLIRCTVDLRPRGIWFNQCPSRMVAQGVDVWNSNPSPYPQVRVLCAEPEVVCTDLKKNLQK